MKKPEGLKFFKMVKIPNGNTESWTKMYFLPPTENKKRNRYFIRSGGWVQCTKTGKISKKQ